MSSLVTRERLSFIDAAKGLSILMIMMGHITELGNPLDVWMSSLKICSFYFISGGLMAYTRSLHRRTPAQFVTNLMRVIAWPYLTFSVIAIAAKCFFKWSKPSSWDVVYEVFNTNLCKTVFLNGINSMWFMPTLFVGELVVLLLFLAPKIFSWLYGVFGLFALRGATMLIARIEETGLSEDWKVNLGYLVGMMGKGLIAAWFIGAGYVIFTLLMKKDLLKGHYGMKFILGLIMTASNVYLSQLNAKVDFNNLRMGEKPYLFVYGGIVGTIGMMWLLDAASSRISLAPLEYWGRNSLILMCTHTALGFKWICYEGWSSLAGMPDVVCKRYYLQNFMVLFILMFVMYGVIEFINKYAKFLTAFPRRKAAAGKTA